jgi:hypothetical protein
MSILLPMKIIVLFVLILLFSNAESFKLKKLIKKGGEFIKDFAKETLRGLKGGPREVKPQHVSPIPSTRPTPSWAGEKIISAHHVSRPLDGDKLKYLPVDHHGIVFETDVGNKRLLHNTPKFGVVVTDAKYMSSKWNIVSEIEVKGDKTVAGAIRSAGSNSNDSEKCGYWKGGTCIYTRISVEGYLKK